MCNSMVEVDGSKPRADTMDTMKHRRSRTRVPIPRAAFGAARLFDIGGTFNSHDRLGGVLPPLDEEALWGDWSAIGTALRESIGQARETLNDADRVAVESHYADIIGR